jgi:hypothetical protein
MKRLLLGLLVLGLVGCAGPWRHPDGTPITEADKTVCAGEISRGLHGYGNDPLTDRAIMDSCLYQKGFRQMGTGCVK